MNLQKLAHCVIALGIAAINSAPLGDAAEAVPHFRTLPPPRILYICERVSQATSAERIRAVACSDVTVAPLIYDDLAFHHLCDKPLEETEEMTRAVTETGAKFVEDCLSRLTSFDLVIASFQPHAHSNVAERIAAHVRSGGRLIFINPSWETTFEGSPLADIMPVAFDGIHRRWVYSCGPATDHPLSRGIPLELTGAHWWGPIYTPAAADCVPLTGFDGDTRFWYREIREGGRIVHLFQHRSGRWQWGDSSSSYEAYEGDRPDESEAWDAFDQRLVYWLVHGDEAFPILVKVIASSDAVAVAGDMLKFRVDVENRLQGDRRVILDCRLGARRVRKTVTDRILVDLKGGERREIAVSLPVDLPCADSHVRLSASALDSTGKVCFSESVTWLPFVHAISLAILPERKTYLTGEKILADVSWTNLTGIAAPKIRVMLVDRSGRALQQSATFAGTGVTGRTSVLLAMPVSSPEHLSSYWLTAVAEDNKRIVGCARVQVHRDDPWDMRRQMQWSVWTHGGEPRLLDLMADAGFNALGMIGNASDADRRGWHQYTEGTGINTFGVTIDHTDWLDVRRSMEGVISNLNAACIDSRSKSLVSLGEESGFKGGWGQRYYWDGQRAPEIPQCVFDEYLSELYDGRIGDLNTEWGAAYGSFHDVPLEAARVRQPGQVFVTAQAWEAKSRDDAAQDLIPVDDAATGSVYLAHSAPYIETYGFFDWYYQRYCDLATEVYRKQRNPVPLTIMSAPAGFYPKVDVYNFAGLGPFYPKETGLAGNAIARRDYGDAPGFSGAMWAYFDLRPLWSASVLSSIIAGNTHIDYWVDVPLTFNPDFTHTRGSFWTKELNHRLRPIVPVLLHKRFAFTSGLGMYVPAQPLPKGLFGRQFSSSIAPNVPLYSALEESGYMPRVVQPQKLAKMGIKVLFASYAQVVSPEEGMALGDFVKKGGMLVATPWLASCSRHGNMLREYPSEESGLKNLLGFALRNTSQEPLREEVVWRGLKLVSMGRDKIQGLSSDVAKEGAYKDGTPLVLERKVGAGRVVYINMIYDWEGWWNSFHEPGREAYRRLIASLLEEDGRVWPEYFISFTSASPVTENKGWWGMHMKSVPASGSSVPWWASQLYSDPSGTVRYLGIFADHRSPRVTAEVRWREPRIRMRDLLRGQSLEVRDGRVGMSLGPGEAALLAVTPEPAPKLQCSAPRLVQAGETLEIAISFVGGSLSVYGVAVDVYTPDGRLSRAHSVGAADVPGNGYVRIPTALNDPAGVYRFVVREPACGLVVEGRFTLRGLRESVGAALLTPFPPRAEESWPAEDLSSAEFLALLRKLRDIYLGTLDGMEDKYALSYYLHVPFRPENRHGLMRRLQRADWLRHLGTVAAALRVGEMFVLTGEDLNRDPLTGLAIDPFAAADPMQFVERLAKERGARRRTSRAGGMYSEIIELGTGRLVVVHESADRSAYTADEFMEWHARLRAAIGDEITSFRPPD